MRTFWFYTYLVISLFPKYFQSFKMKKLKKTLSEKEFIALADWHITKWACKQVRNTGARVTITGAENIPEHETVLFISNHQSNFDIGIFLGLIHKPKGFIAKYETLKLPIIRTWMKFINCVFMDRTDMKKQAKAILEGIKLIEEGNSMVLFPEGTRSKGDKTGEFKAGSFKLATKTLVKIIPVTIDGSYKIIESNNNRIRPADVFVTIHKPIETKEMTKEELSALPDIVEKIIKSGFKNNKNN